MARTVERTPSVVPQDLVWVFPTKSLNYARPRHRRRPHHRPLLSVGREESFRTRLVFQLDRILFLFIGNKKSSCLSWIAEMRRRKWRWWFVYFLVYSDRHSYTGCSFLSLSLSLLCYPMYLCIDVSKSIFFLSLSLLLDLVKYITLMGRRWIDASCLPLQRWMRKLSWEDAFEKVHLINWQVSVTQSIYEHVCPRVYDK